MAKILNSKWQKYKNLHFIFFLIGYFYILGVNFVVYRICARYTSNMILLKIKIYPIKLNRRA